MNYHSVLSSLVSKRLGLELHLVLMNPYLVQKLIHCELEGHRHHVVLNRLRNSLIVLNYQHSNTLPQVLA